jgi:predicted ATPase
MIVISGEPGIGKSRLTLALTQSISEDCRLISFQCSSYHTNSAWYPIVHFLQRAAGITPEISHSLQLDRLEEFVRQILEKTTSSWPCWRHYCRSQRGLAMHHSN